MTATTPSRASAREASTERMGVCVRAAQERQVEHVRELEAPM